MDMTFNLKHMRRQYGLSQTILADLLGVNQATISRWEKGIEPLSARRRCEILDIFTNRRGRIDPVILQVIKGSPLVTIFDKDYRFLHASEPLAATLNQNREDIIGRSYFEVADSSWCDQILGSAQTNERLSAEFAHDLWRVDATENSAIWRVLSRNFWLDFEGRPGVCVAFVELGPATGEAPRLLQQIDARDVEHVKIASVS